MPAVQSHSCTVHAFIYIRQIRRNRFYVYETILQTLADKLHNIDFHLVVVVATWNVRHFIFSKRVCSFVQQLEHIYLSLLKLGNNIFFADIKWYRLMIVMRMVQINNECFCALCRDRSCWFSILWLLVN